MTVRLLRHTLAALALSLCALAATNASAQDVPPEADLHECAQSLEALAPTRLMSLANTQHKRNRWRLIIDEDSPCLAFNDEFLSRVRLLELPEYKGPYRIKVSSVIKSKMWKKAERRMFSPAVQLLDESFVATREFVRGDFRYRGGKISHTVFINEENRTERYVLVFTTPEVLGQTESHTTGTVNTIGAPVGGVFVVITAGDDLTATIVNVPEGELRVEVIGHPDQAEAGR